MTTKTLDCVQMKNHLQEELFNSLKPKDGKDYLEKLKKSIDNSLWIKQILDGK